MRWLLLLAAASALIVAGCGSSSAARESSATPSSEATPPPTTQPTAVPARPPRIYTKRELARLVLQPKDAPRDMRYLKGESGSKTLEQIGFILPRQIKEMRSYGFRAAQDAVFAARSRQSDRRVAERVWLMKNPSLASRWLGKSKGDSTRLGFAQLQSADLGDESWSASGQANGVVVVTHAFRLGNAVFVVSSFSGQETLSPAAARAAAFAALARARKV